MFQDSNIILFLLCLAPVIFYSLIIFANSPSFSIRLKTSFTYFYSGLLSITLLQFISFIFPHLHDMFLKIYVGEFSMDGKTVSVYQPTLASLVLYAFFQVAVFEELSKWLAFQSAGLMRGQRRKNLDHPYATMFYCALVAAAFSIVENIQYATRAIRGEFQFISPENLLTIRAVSSVVIHMVCGLFIGYFIGLSKGKNRLQKIIYNISGLALASFIHGLYDFNWMRPGSENDYYKLFNLFPVHLSTVGIISFSLFIAFIMSAHLKSIYKPTTKQLG